NVWTIGLLLQFGPANIPRLDEVNTDTRVFVFTLGISVLTGFIFGIVPAIQTARPVLSETLKDGSRGLTGSLSHNRGRTFLMVGDIALSLVLLIGASLLVKSFMRLLDVKPGFSAANIMTMKLAFSQTLYPDGAHQKAFFQQVLENVRALPGVESASVV